MSEKISKQAIEKKLLDDYLDDLTAIHKQLFKKAGTGQTSTLQSEMEKKIDIYKQQVLNYKNQFPQENIDNYEANIYYFRALLKMSSTGWAGAMGEDILNRPDDPGCLAMLFGAALSTNESFKYNREAIELLDRALSIYNSLEYHHTKAMALNSMGKCEDAIQELEYIMEHTDDETLYVKARKFKDEISQSLQGA